MHRTTLPLSSPILNAMHPGNPHGLRFAEGDTDDKGDGGAGKGDTQETTEKAPPWERKGEEFDAEKAKTYITSLQSERDREAAARKAAEAKVKEHDDAKLSETERLERERDDAKSTAAQKAALADRYEVAEEVGLPLSWARRLVGDDREALLADAKAMKADLDEKSKGGTPRHDPSQGGGGGAGKTSLTEAMEEARNRRAVKKTD